MSINNKKDNDNLKKILCFNMLNNKNCNYGNKCMYAHNLNEQKIEPLRHKVYTMIRCADNLSNIDLINDNKLFETIVQLTRICTLCNKGLCPGGYNCRNGAINIKCKICYDDLMNGNCKRNNCLSIHLTDRGLVPYIKQKNKDYDNSVANENKYKYTDNNDKYYNKKRYTIETREKDNNKIRKDLDNVKGILLTEKFLISHFGKSLHNDTSSDSDSDNEEEIEKIIKFLNDGNDDNSDDESIFLV